MTETADPSPMDDAELVRHVAVGGEAGRNAEAEICRRLWPRVRIFLGRHLSDIHAVDDVAQEVILSTLKALRDGKVRDPRRLGAFALGTSRNKVREHVRRAAATREALERLPAPEPVPARSAPLRLGRLEECLSLLRERQRMVLRAVFCEGKSSRETADELELTAANVRVLQLRAIEQLRTCVSSNRFEVER